MKALKTLALALALLLALSACGPSETEAGSAPPEEAGAQDVQTEDSAPPEGAPGTANRPTSPSHRI